MISRRLRARFDGIYLGSYRLSLQLLICGVDGPEVQLWSGLEKNRRINRLAAVFPGATCLVSLIVWPMLTYFIQRKTFL